MTPIVNICNINDLIRITDVTQDSNEYIPENITDTLVYNQNNKFKYSETCTINVIQYVSTKDKEILETIYTEHCSYLDEAYYKVLKDGHYTIHHFILPTVDWLQEELTKQDNLTQDHLSIYVTDGEKVYLYNQGSLNEIDIQVLIEINDEDTTISRISIDTFSIYYLRKCYIQICKTILNTIDLKCVNNNKSMEEVIFNRDLLWMTINIIKYHVEFNDLIESQRLIELINKCGGMCQNIPATYNKNNFCGCTR